MPNIINFSSKKAVNLTHHEWTEVGIHLEFMMSNGMSTEQAISLLVDDGIPESRIARYLENEEYHHPDGLAQVESLYTLEENTIIQTWIRERPFFPDASGTVKEHSGQIADIVLFPVRQHLPQWALVYKSGKVETNRKHPLKLFMKRDKLLHPIFLLEINWADSGPGFSWPESYYLTYLPGYNFYVLTASQDSTEVHGVLDFALDLVYPARDGYPPLLDAVQSVRNWWEAERDDWHQGPWESLWNPGCYDPYFIENIRDEVWEDYLY